MQNINLSVPDDIVFEIKSLPRGGATINAKLQLSLAIGMFVSKEISLARAAQLAGKNLCAVERHGRSAGSTPARQLSLQPVAIGAVVEVTKRLKPPM